VLLGRGAVSSPNSLGMGASNCQRNRLPPLLTPAGGAPVYVDRKDTGLSMIFTEASPGQHSSEGRQRRL
jgi:hypothetical protein